MAKSPLPLLLLAGGAFLMARSKDGSGSEAKTESDKPESASPEKDTAETKKGAPLLIMTKECQPIVPPEDSQDRENFQAAVGEYIARRSKEIYLKAKAGTPPRQRLNANLTPEQGEKLKAGDPDIEVNFSNFTFPMEDLTDIWYSVYLELVPPECAMQTVWSEANQTYEDPLFPSPAAACMGAIIRIQSAEALTAMGAPNMALAPEKIAELLASCAGMEMAIGDTGQ